MGEESDTGFEPVRAFRQGVLQTPAFARSANRSARPYGLLSFCLPIRLSRYFPSLDEEKGAARPSSWPSAPFSPWLRAGYVRASGLGWPRCPFLCHGIGGLVGSASAPQAIGWAPNWHTGAAAIVTMVGMVTVMMSTVLVILDGTSSWSLLRGEPLPPQQIV